MKNRILLFIAISVLPFMVSAQNNLLDITTWTVGTGSVSGFTRYGSDAENVREMGVDPHGQSNVLWTIYPDGSNSADGGWITNDIPIDANKTYRFTVWAKKTVSFDCTSYYYGRAEDSSGNTTVLKLNNNSMLSARFFNGDLPGLDQWYLVVGFIHHTGYSSTTSLGGIYDINGNKLVSGEDYKFALSTSTIHQRILNANCTETTSRQYYYLPTIYEVNGQEPTIQELVNGPGGGDTQNPTAPTLSSNGQTDTTADFSWSGATDNTAVTNYNLYKDGVLEAPLGNVSTYQVTGLTGSTPYNFTVTALDAAGNESTVSNSVPVTTNASSGGGSSVWSESNSVANYTGDVAIGTSTVPSGYKLAVHGKIISEELKVQLSGDWPDYVFAKDYDLTPLEEVQKYIKEQGHLPKIPSAKEVEKNGLEVGEMNRLLLEKIEELTLYVLIQEKRLQRLEKGFTENNN